MYGGRGDVEKKCQTEQFFVLSHVLVYCPARRPFSRDLFFVIMWITSRAARFRNNSEIYVDFINTTKKKRKCGSLKFQ